MKLSNILSSIKNGTFFFDSRIKLSRIFAPKGYCVIRDMAYVSNNIYMPAKYYDYVREKALFLIADVLCHSDNGEFNVAELGVYKGDFARLINQAFSDKNLYLFDTFEGFSQDDIKQEKKNKYSTGEQDFSDTSAQIVLNKMIHPEKCFIRQGWFPDTTNGLEDLRFGFVSIDADLYEPVYAGLKYFYPRLMENGGAIFVHDYNNEGYRGVKEAVKLFSKENSIGYICLPDICGTAVLVK